MMTWKTEIWDNWDVSQKLSAVQNWLDYQHVGLTYGLKKPEDAIKLYVYWMSHDELPEFCDDDTEDNLDLAKYRKLALRYDPIERYLNCID